MRKTEGALLNFFFERRKMKCICIVFAFAFVFVFVFTYVFVSKLFLCRRQGRKKTAGIPNPKRMFEEVSSRFHLLFPCKDSPTNIIWSFSFLTNKRTNQNGHWPIVKIIKKWFSFIFPALQGLAKIYQTNQPKFPLIHLLILISLHLHC